ncbi:fimbria/pilus outer membrane usher protein [Salmonella enterica subsp. enterica]|nr:fimbria/pilus outer membrane usher protein [Salmonella enterica subsp. enterica]
MCRSRGNPYQPRSFSFYGTANNPAPGGCGSDYQYSRFDSGQGASQSDFICRRRNSFRAPPALRSKLTPRTDVPSVPLFLTLPLCRAHFASDGACRRPSLQYAPKISGTANSNAQVTVSQERLILYHRPGVAGAF